MRPFIYGLVDPRTLLVRYVGSSTRGLRRPRQHGEPYRLRTHNHKNAWIKSLHAFGLDYEIVILEETSSREVLPALERFWIAYGRACGWPLTNLTDGGEGTLGVERSAETRERMAAALRGKKRSRESVKRQFTVRKANGYQHSEATRAKMRASNLGQKRPPSVGLAVAESNRRRARKAHV